MCGYIVYQSLEFGNKPRSWSRWPELSSSWELINSPGGFGVVAICWQQSRESALWATE